MRNWLQKRPLLRYLFAVLATAIGVGIVIGVEPFVGYVPMLFLPLVALVEAYAGPEPAMLSTALCVLASFRFMNVHPIVNEHLHNLTKLGLFPIVSVAVVYLMEARRKERRVAREQLLELSTLLESMPEAVFIFGRNARLVDVNRAAEQICACGRDELRGAHVNFLAKHLGIEKHEQPMPLTDLAVTRALRGDQVQNEARVYSNPTDGSPVNALVSANPMRGEEGVIIGALLVVRDVTEITQLQRRVADTERHLAIGQMASGIAHDFNNVLNTITQAVALLEMNPDREERR